MKKQIVFIHGGTAFSEYGMFLTCLKTREVRDLPGQAKAIRWKESFREDLGADFEVYMPSMPNRENAKYEEWKIWFERHLGFLRDGVILIGHSLGGMFLAKYLAENRMPVSVRALYLLAAPAGQDTRVGPAYPAGKGGVSGEDGGDFVFEVSILKDMQSDIKDIFIFHSTDDPVVPYSDAEIYCKTLSNAALVTFDNKGHFLDPAFPELIAHVCGL